MQFICDGPHEPRFTVDAEGEVIQESQFMNYAVEIYLRLVAEDVATTFVPPVSTWGLRTEERPEESRAEGNSNCGNAKQS
jgi:hypothetical protein